ncbi:hypothetical protein GCM10009125_04990 [Castellaniella daejeonensis]|uniref:FtsK gamma domain-containing protein n=1 Tax=Castellaniella daejeonensis TaxID=659013 RepID=A0ABN0TDS4_9BURK
MNERATLYHPELEKLAKAVSSQVRWVSVSLFQIHLRIGYGKALAIMQSLEDQGLVGPIDAQGQHQVLMSDARENPEFF